MSRHINIGGLDFWPNTLDSGFVYNDLKNWYGISGAKSGGEERPRQMGQFIGDQSTLDKLTVSLSGFYEGSSYVDAVRAKRRLGRLFNSGRDVRFYFDDEDTPSYRYVRAVNIVPDHSGGNTWFTYNMDFETGETPFRYAETPFKDSTGLYQSGTGILDPLSSPLNEGAATNDGRAFMTNDGDADAWPSFIVKGGMGNGFILRRVDTGQAIEVTYPISSSSRVYLNSEDGTITLDGDDNDISGSATTQWWYLAPGETAEVQFISKGPVSGTPLLTVITPQPLI